MDRAIYDPESKTIMLQFERTVIHLDVEEIMPMMEALETLVQNIMEDPEIFLGTVTDEDGTEHQEFIVKDIEEEYS
jgi:tetrahydromethanopterin S-methyltransferase subunit B